MKPLKTTPYADPTKQWLDKHTRGEDYVQSDPRGRVTITVLSSIRKLHARGVLGATEEAAGRLYAGERYEDTYERAKLAGELPSPKWEVGYDPTPSSGDHDHCADARLAMAQAVAKMGRRTNGVLERIIIQGVGLERAGHSLGFRMKAQALAAAKQHLLAGLDVLRELWRL